MYHKTKRRKARTRRAIPPEREETIQVSEKVIKRKAIMNQKQTQCKQIIYCAKVYEARLKVLAYMQAEDVMKAQEALDKWAEIVKGVDDVNH